MLTDKQLEANRANAQKSTGPRTPEGKNRSRLNAYRHGLSSQVLIVPEEEMEAFNQFVEELAASFTPADVREQQLAQSYATFQWRINRAASIENNMFTLGLMEEVGENLNIENPQAHNAASQAKTFRSESQEFARLSMYSQRLMNQAAMVFKQLTYLQHERRRRENREINGAMDIYKLHKTHGVVFDPQASGFVLKIAQIEAEIHRTNLSKSSFVADIAARAREKAA